MRHGLAVVITLATAMGGAGCAHAPAAKENPQALFDQVCGVEKGVGRRTAGVQGGVWLKAESKDAKGQFPAEVNVQAPDTLRLEVTNLLGGTEAIISVDGSTYTVQVPSRKQRTEKGTGSWGGIPLRWATELFLGRIPCPTVTAANRPAVTATADGDLRVDAPASLGGDSERFTYGFRTWGGELWPETLTWEKLGAFSQRVSFKFDDPEDGTGSPRKWEAQSAHGEIKVRWKDRKVSALTQVVQ